MKQVLCIAFALILAPVGLTFADGHREAPPAPKGSDELPPQTEFFDTFDRNADGAVTTDEYPHSAESFRLLDKNGDGKIDTAELGLPADYRPDPRAKRRREQVRAKEAQGDGLRGARSRIRRMFEKMDTNGDGAISRGEWTGRPELFDRMDRNQDGKLDPDDRPRGGRADGDRGNDRRFSKKAFESLDKDGDGQLGAQEMPRPEMARFDKDGDGALSFKEFKAIGQDRRRGDRRRGLNPRQLERFDKDGDGTVTAEEFPGNERLFQRLDANGDGVLTKADVRRRKPDGPKTDGRQDEEPAKESPVTTPPTNIVASNDKDGDGKLNRAEFPGSDEQWKHLDRNADGWITKNETGEAKAQRTK